MKVILINQDKLELLAKHPNPLKAATHLSYNEIAALVAEVYEMRRKFGMLRVRDLDAPAKEMEVGHGG